MVDTMLPVLPAVRPCDAPLRGTLLRSLQATPAVLFQAYGRDLVAGTGNHDDSTTGPPSRGTPV